MMHAMYTAPDDVDCPCETAPCGGITVDEQCAWHQDAANLWHAAENCDQIRQNRTQKATKDTSMENKQPANELARDVLGEIAKYLEHRSHMYAALHCSDEVHYPPLMGRVQEAIRALDHDTELDAWWPITNQTKPDNP